MDDSQQVLKRLLGSDPGENSKTLLSIQRDYHRFPQNTRRAAELLGEEHYLYNTLMARSYWFEGYINDESECPCINISNANRILPFYKKALEYEPQMPHALLQIAVVYGKQKQQPDSAAYYANLALDAVPGWLLVYHWVANIYLTRYQDSKKEAYLKKAKDWLDRGMAVDSNAVVILDQLAFWYNLKGLYKEEQAVLDKSFSVDSLAQTYFFKGQGYLNWGKFEEAEKAFRYAGELDSAYLLHYGGIHTLYTHTFQDKKIKKLARELLDKG